MVGGDDGSSNLHSVEYYNPTADTWTLIKTTMETARSYAGVAVIDRPKFFIQVNYKIYKILIQLLFFKLNSSNNGDCLKRMKHNSRSPIDHHRPIQRINKRIKVWQLHYQKHVSFFNTLMTSSKTRLPYEYYSLPMCMPEKVII